MNKKGLSPVIATVLLVALVLVLASIIYLWAGAFIPETIEKNGEIIESSCNNVVFDASYFGGSLRIQNNGNIPIYGVRYGAEEFGSLEYNDLIGTIASGGTRDWPIGESADKIRVIPILLGEKSDGELAAFACEESAKVI